MGRLVEPITDAEYARLPRWQQWIGRHPYLYMAAAFLVAMALTYLAGRFGLN